MNPASEERSDLLQLLRNVRNYTFWLVIYILLLFIVQPLVYLFVFLCDFVWTNFPVRGLKYSVLSSIKALALRFSPSLAKKYISKNPCGNYNGCDKECSPQQKKQIPFHSVSLNGCAWMLPYHIGVCKVLKAEGMVDENTLWLGSSGGALIATAAALNLDLDFQLNFCVSMGIESKEQHALGPAGKMSQYIGPHVLRSLPPDSHKIACGKLFISVTETPKGSKLYGNTLISNFDSVNHLYDSLMASTYIPIYYETPVRPGSTSFYWDGGFTNNQPTFLDSDGKTRTTTVSPTSGMADISPTVQTTANIEHLFPGNYKTAMKVYNSGVKDAKVYINKLRAK